MSRVERVERFLSLAVGIAAITAVLVSLYQSQLARAQLRASAWPYLTQGNSMTAETPYRYVVSNEGIGPARVKASGCWWTTSRSRRGTLRCAR